MMYGMVDGDCRRAVRAAVDGGGLSGFSLSSYADGLWRGAKDVN